MNTYPTPLMKKHKKLLGKRCSKCPGQINNKLTPGFMSYHMKEPIIFFFFLHFLIYLLFLLHFMEEIATVTSQDLLNIKKKKKNQASANNVSASLFFLYCFYSVYYPISKAHITGDNFAHKYRVCLELF